MKTMIPATKSIINKKNNINNIYSKIYNIQAAQQPSSSPKTITITIRSLPQSQKNTRMTTLIFIA